MEKEPIHKKVWKEYFEKIISGKKKFELRLASERLVLKIGAGIVNSQKYDIIKSTICKI